MKSFGRKQRHSAIHLCQNTLQDLRHHHYPAFIQLLLTNDQLQLLPSTIVFPSSLPCCHKGFVYSNGASVIHPQSNTPFHFTNATSRRYL
ncbi:hypothetical protein Patl1_30031 [Pistacia atlantica]|uniref:Uncharacterized protein n=1 Tax=Pistacia atlantica TaxID=434234 RepID=A0ACC1AAK9_9ROSI|nr:hypothetical protein Patl1_30031 [Pistacia atlantica]